MKYADSLAKINVIRTGTILDRLSGIGGIPRGRITEIFGDPSLGKSTLSLQTIANIQKDGLKCLYADVEFTFDTRYAEAVGVDTSKLGIIREKFAEDTLDALEKEAESGEWDIIFLDAVGALLPRTEAEKTAGEKSIASQASLVARFCRKIVPIIALNDTALVVLNHSFTDLMSGAVKTSGGAKLEFHKSFSVRLRKSNKVIKSGEKVIGKVVIAQVRKNKVGPTEGMEVEANLLLGQGFSAQEDTLAEAIERGNIFEKVGNTYLFQGERIGTIGKLREKMSDQSFADKVKALL